MPNLAGSMANRLFRPFDAIGKDDGAFHLTIRLLLVADTNRPLGVG